MAEAVDPEQNKEGSAPDPVTDVSLSTPMLISMAILFLTLAWGLFDELVTQRPWKAYQYQFVKSYTAYLKKVAPRQKAAEDAIFKSAEYQKIDQQLKAAEQAAVPRVTEIEHQLQSIRRRLAVIKDPFQDARAKIASMTYDLDHTGSTGGKDSLRKDIEEVKKQSFKVSFSTNDGLPPVAGGTITFDQMNLMFVDLKAREAKLVEEQAVVTKSARDLRKQRNEYLSEHLTGLNQQQIDGLLRKMDTFKVEIKQIHVEEAALVDRCESCHLGIREPLTLTAADMGGKQVFVSHPNKTLLTLHDPDKFGCSSCHNGNGVAVSSVEKAHGYNEHWLWPMFHKENAEAGCVQCHTGDRVMVDAPILTRGEDLFQLKGCVGCHRHEAFDREADGLANVRKDLQNIATQQRDARLESAREVKAGDSAESNEEAQKHYARAEYLKVNSGYLDARASELQQKEKYLLQDQKKVGPNLKDAKLKLHKEWIPVWLKDPQAFRPGTKMPTFRLTDAEIRALSAFVWQNSLEGPKLASQPKGDAAKGKEAFETRGCLACHSIGEGSSRIGDEFAANLTRLGEKANYDYIVRWVHNPRERTAPYCPREQRDLTAEDYSKHGLPFSFDLEHSSCPNDGAQLQVQNMTVMPSQRLSLDEARNIATYLTGLKHNDATYPNDVAFMDDPKLAETGMALVGRYGCASCHEIKGLEEAARIGTELTKEASKPIEQLDFGLLEPKAEKEGWYNHKGFFEHKLDNPAVFDTGREKAPEDKLRMPKPQLTKDDITALTTFLLGSQDTPFQGEFRTIPEQFRYIPTDQYRDIQEGWWLVKKYNCMGCHTVQVGQKSVLAGMAKYQDPDWKDQLPPSLVQEGARVNPEWLTRFLTNPALNESDTDRNGVRTYLKARMPTFNFSPNEVAKLVRFFGALSSVSEPYIPVKVKPVDERERELARALFTSKAAPCLKCHLTGDPNHDKFATAPNFLMARERLQAPWMQRWLLDPQAISPGTPMPSGLFRRDGDHWVFNGETPAIFKGYEKDQVELLVRYMLQLTPEEQHRLSGMIPATTGSNGSKPDSSMRAAVSQR